jgi:hypothetical protein
MSGELCSVIENLDETVSAIRRRFETVDMMLSMHSMLAQENERRALFLDLTILCSSLFLVATAWVDPEVLPFFHVSAQGVRIALAVCSLAVFALSIVGLRVDWKERAGRHQRAAMVLTELKMKWRALVDGASEGEQTIARELDQQAQFAMSLLPAIPENAFHRLKAHHKLKIALSKMVDRYPGAWLPLLRLKIIWRESRAAVRDTPPK